MPKRAEVDESPSASSPECEAGKGGCENARQNSEVKAYILALQELRKSHEYN
jgi:hypothetical protein